MRQQQVNRTDIRRARRSRQRRRELGSPDAPVIRRGGGGADVDDELLLRITRIIEETAALRRATPHAP